MRGFAALISVLVISATLVSIALATSFAVYAHRAELLDHTDGLRSQALAELCLARAVVYVEQRLATATVHFTTSVRDECRVVIDRSDMNTTYIQVQATSSHAVTSVRARYDAQRQVLDRVPYQDLY